MTIFAYIDPGLGLLAWQAVLAAFLGALFYLKKTRTWLVTTLQKLFRAGRKTATEAARLQPPGPKTQQ